MRRELDRLGMVPGADRARAPADGVGPEMYPCYSPLSGVEVSAATRWDRPSGFRASDLSRVLSTRPGIWWRYPSTCTCPGAGSNRPARGFSGTWPRGLIAAGLYKRRAVGSGCKDATVAASRSDLQRRLMELLDDPREDMAVEIKDWLDLADKCVAADFAREVLALANHGGGTVLFGFADDATGWPPSGACAYSGRLYSQDAINNLCKRYADPPFHCTVHRLESSTGNDHVLIEVPGGHRTPVRSRRDGPPGSRLKANVYYVRRPGPESAPIGSAQEWDTLLRRCMSAQREELLDSFRTIARALGAGGGILTLLGAEPDPSLAAWIEESRARLDELMAEELPDERPSRYAPGTFSAAYIVLDPVVVPSLQNLMTILEDVHGSETGWPPWTVFHRPDLRPRPGDHLIECWLRETTFGDGAHSDFWRVAIDGKAFLLRGYQEDSVPDQLIPGAALDLTIPVWRTGECLLHAARLAERLGGTRIEFGMEWTGLRGRQLSTFASPERVIGGKYIGRQDKVSTAIETDVSAVADTLPELVQHLVEPMYASFDFFKPGDLLYAQEIAKLRDRTS